MTVRANLLYFLQWVAEHISYLATLALLSSLSSLLFAMIQVRRKVRQQMSHEVVPLPGVSHALVIAVSDDLALNLVDSVEVRQKVSAGPGRPSQGVLAPSGQSVSAQCS